ncbi:glycosyltransferase [Bacteroides sp.]
MKKLKILIVNKFLYNRGGAEIYTINFGKLLQKYGHEVRFYSMKYQQNISTPEDCYFADEVSFFNANLTSRIKAILRILGKGNIQKSFKKILDDYQPDVIHLNNIHSYLSPIIARIAYKHNIPVIWTLHDYKLICPSYLCLCHGQICEACYHNKFNVVRRKCMKNSLQASLLAWIEACLWNTKKIEQWTNAFICPSHFIAQKMQNAGLPKEKLNIICNFIDQEKTTLLSTQAINANRSRIYAYVGRLSNEKGIESLIKQAINLPYTLYIAGTGPLEETFHKKYSAPNIVFLGHLNSIDTIKLLCQCKFTVIPSVCYENNPLSVIESLCCGTPVIGRRIGGIPDLLAIDACNRLFDTDDELANIITEMFDSDLSKYHKELSAKALHFFSEQHYYESFLPLLERFFPKVK